MSAKPKPVYKYIGPNFIDKVFQSADTVALKCSLPKDFNDPYELFLTIDFNDEPDALAYYVEAIGDLPQHPTTCFSRSPIVIPMWAHYAQNLEGFVIEFSQERLDSVFPDCGFENVTYSDAPSEHLSGLLHMAYKVGKMRHTYFLQRSVMHAAYFTKATCWSYEQECRMIVSESDAHEEDALCLLKVPNNCITSLICGPRASKQTKRALIRKAKKLGCRYFELRIGKSSAIPYLVDADKQSFSFDGNEIRSSHQSCHTCGEPVAVMVEQCSWCQIDDGLRRHVASRNPLRILDRYGLLEDYIKSMDAIGAKHRKR